jgi:4-amino-4-deoxy-L-arabinose transferase-like glycosyltransferase
MQFGSHQPGRRVFPVAIVTRVRAFDYALFVAAVGLTRFLFRSRYLYDLDSVNFALGMGRFDPTVHQPHPPGYFLYVCLGRLAQRVFPDANTALVALSILASCATAEMIYALTDEWFGSRAAVFAGLLFLFSPLCWFHGIVALTYIFEAFFSALVGYLCWRAYQGRAWFLVPAAVALGIAAGFRQSTLLFLGPLWLLSLRRARWDQRIVGAGALVLSVLVWFFPMLRESGGSAAYFGSLYRLWKMVPAKRTVVNSSITMSIARFCAIVGGYGICFGAACGLPWLASPAAVANRDKKVFTWTWILPGLLFFTFVFFVFVNSGYLLVLSPPAFAWLGWWAAAWYGEAPVRRGKTVLVGTFAAINTAFFLFVPLYCSYRSVRMFERELTRDLRSVRSLGGPSDTLIVGVDAHFLGYRHAGYYLPDYLTVQYPEQKFPDGERVFAMERRQTVLLDKLPLDRFKSFVIFPLPPGAEYREYLKGLSDRFPPGELRTSVAEGREFLIPAAQLQALFPTVATPGRAYTQSDSGR